MNQRRQVILAIFIAGYHNDIVNLTSLCIENNISLFRAKDTFSKGSNARFKGLRCNCFECAQPLKFAIGERL